jgi:hypothetical protein
LVHESNHIIVFFDEDNNIVIVANVQKSSSSGIASVNVHQKKLQEGLDERRDFEEERFIRLVRMTIVT